MADNTPSSSAAQTLREIRRAAPGPVGRWRNRLALLAFGLIATPGLVERTHQNRIDAAYWRGHLRRREMGFVKCEEVVDAD